MDEIITTNKITWDARSNDVLGFCANHPIESYQLDNYLSTRKLQEAIKNDNIQCISYLYIYLIDNFRLDD
jgi:hypothetical protein